MAGGPDVMPGIEPQVSTFPDDITQALSEVTLRVSQEEPEKQYCSWHLPCMHSICSESWPGVSPEYSGWVWPTNKTKQKKRRVTQKRTLA